MQTFSLDIEAYIEAHTSPESAVLAELNRQTHLQMLMPRMLSGHLQGKFLQMIVRMIRPKFILEIGTFTGYAAICMAEAMPQDCVLHTVEKNDEVETFIRTYIRKAGFEDRLHLHIGDATEVVEGLDCEWDLIFLDADKPNYPKYFELLAPKMKRGAWIVADNVLWGGKIVHDPKTFDAYTNGIVTYNRLIQESDAFENVLLPMRDGLLVAQKL